MNTYVFRLDLRHCLLTSDFETIYNILFTRRKVNETPSLRRLINTNAVTTRLKRTFKDSEDSNDDSMEEILIFWKFDHLELPRIRSNLISIFDEKLDRHNFKLLNRSKYFFVTSGIWKK